MYVREYYTAITIFVLVKPIFSDLRFRFLFSFDI